MDVSKVGVVGCGTMGAGICEIVARSGISVSFVEVTGDRVEDGLQRIRSSLQRAVGRGRLSADDLTAVMERIDGDTSYAVLRDADLVVEAVPEKLDIKQHTFRRLDEVLKPEAILATNTSSLPVTDIAVTTHRANRILGFHFFNPAPVMKLIELVTTVVTEPRIIADATAFAERIGKTPIVAKDRAGFVANRLLFPYLNQAVGMYEAGFATREDIDAAMKLATGHPMGPLALMDLIGLDSAHAIMMRMYQEFGDTRHVPRPLVRHLLAAGYTGRKAGRGFYRYVEASEPATDDERAAAAVDVTVVDRWTKVGVVGTGPMAVGLAEVSVRAGYDVLLCGRSSERADQARSSVAAGLARGGEPGKPDATTRNEALEPISTTTDFGDFGDCDIVIEAVAEDMELKREVFGQLDSATKPDAVLGTTTSSIPVIECAMATGHPEQVVGIHFFNPAAVTRLVEVVPTVRTGERTTAQAMAFAAKLGKHPVLSGDRAGFIVNALLFPYLNDAVKMLEEGYASVVDIDEAMKLGCGHPTGPFELMDVVGLDVTLQIVRALYTESREPGFEPAPLLGHMVSAGYLGRKAGRGFHAYT